MALFIEGWPLSPIAACLATAVVMYALAYRYSTQKLDTKEPPIIASGIPFVGHLVGMAVYGGKYIKNLGYEPPTAPVYDYLSQRS